MTISKSWFSYLTRAFALSLCTALLLNFVSCSDSSTRQDPKVKIILDANGGSFSETTESTETTQTLLIKKNQTSKLPTADELGLSCANHNFTGWAKSQQGEVEYNDGADITSSTDLTLYAHWEAVNTTYTVKHLLQNLADDSYTEDEEATEQKTGTYGTQTAAAAKTYEGFTAKSFTQETIQADGSTVVEIKYDRNSYTISYSSEYGDAPTSKTVRYGYVLTAADLPDLTQANYSFKGWLIDGASIAAGYIVKKDITLTARWNEIIANYTVKHLLQNLQDDNYTEDSTEQKSGKSGTQTVAAAKTYEGFTDKTFTQETIQEDGTTIIQIYYDRKTYTISYSSTYGEPPESKTVKYEYILTAADLPVLPDTVLSFNGWLFEGASIKAGDTVKKAITLTAHWKAPPSVTKENISEVIAALTEDSTIVLTGELTDSDLAAIATAIKNSTYKVNLDLSQATGITSIPDSTFYYCKKLSGITIPDSVTSIGNNAFNECTSLSSVNIPDSVTSIGSSTFYRCTSLSSVNIPDSVTSIGSWAFYDCTSLSSVTIPDSVTDIGDYAFQGCNSLSSVTIPDSITSIGYRAFYCCLSLSSVTIPDSVTYIGDEAFFLCISLSSITISDSVTSIGECAFGNCTSLESINVDSNNRIYSSIDGVLFNKDATAIITYPAGKQSAAYTIPDSVTYYINPFAFYGCTALTFLTFTDPTNWYRTNNSTNLKNKTGGTKTDVSDPATNATYFKDTYRTYWWYKR